MKFNPIANLTTGKMLQCLPGQTDSHDIYQFLFRGPLTDIEAGHILDYHDTILLALRPHPHPKSRHYNVKAIRLNRTATISRYSDVKDVFGIDRELVEIDSGAPCYFNSRSNGKYELLMPTVDVRVNDRIEIVNGSLFRVTGVADVEEGIRVNVVHVGGHCNG